MSYRRTRVFLPGPSWSAPDIAGPIIAKLKRDANDVLRLPEVSSREDLTGFIRNERRTFAATVKAANIQPE